MNENKLFLSGVCPYCPAVLDYAEDSRAVTCHSCGNVVPTRILRPLDFAKKESAESENDRRIADGVTSSSAGIIYFDNFCDSYDWREFALHSTLSIPTLESIREACKIKFSADPITYYLDFRCVAIPVLKKIEGLDVLEVEIINNYKSDDLSDLFEYVDRYCAITAEITEKRDAIIKTLIKDIHLAQRFGADPMLVYDLKRTFKMFTEKVNAVKAAKNIEEVPGYHKAKELKDAKLAQDIRKKGIDAEKTYAKAIELLEAGNVDNALHLFAAINGYKDSNKYIDDNSMIFKFNNELAEMAGKFYLVKSKSNAVFEPSNPTPISEGVMTLYEVVNAIPSTSPTLTMVSDVIHSFGSKIFFMRNNVSICCYDTKSEDLYANVKILDEAPSGDYVIRHANPIYYSSDKTKFFIRKKLRETATTKRGCLGRKKVTKRIANNRGNNYSIVLVDMDNVTSKVILPEVVDIMDYCNDKIFYTMLEKGSSFPSFRVYDIKEGKSTEILSANCNIHNVSGGNIVYSMRAASEYNINLFSVNVDTNVHRAIDTNINGYYTTHGNRVFYTVGTREDFRLYSANLDGTDRCEVMENPGRICQFSSGWLYYINGSGVNTCLMKVSLDGSKNMLVASRFGKLVKMLNGYIYYLATNGDLKVVRSDGSGDTRIASNIDDLSRIIIDKSNVYYLKRDYLGPATESSDGFGYSLYSTDLAGKNLRKLSHDVSAMVEYNDRYIYICKKREAKYSVTTPIDRKHSKTEIISKTLTYYESYDKLNAEFSEIVRLGLPETVTVTYRKSRLPFSKYITDRSVISEIHNDYVRNDVAPVGMVEREEIEAREKELQRIEDEKREKKQAKKDKKQAKKDKKKAKRDKKKAKRQEKRDKKSLKRENKKAKRQAKQAERDRIKEEKHAKANSDIDDYLAAKEQLEIENQERLERQQAEQDAREAELSAKREEREKARAKRDEENREKYDAGQTRYDEKMARYEEDMIKREEAKQAKRDARAAKKNRDAE